MTQVITATFEDGVLKPDVKLELPAGAKVQLVLTSEPRLTRDQLHDRPTLYSRREQARERIQREWDASFEQRQQAFDELENYRNEHPINSGGNRMTREQLHERR
jgi:predicted DNA-binding antitoxin AbrB/MazE fold protein